MSKSLTNSKENEPPYARENRFVDSWLGILRLPVPKNYLLGLDVQKRDFEDYKKPSYLRGEFRVRGWWYYYVYGLAVKVPLGTWLLLLVALWLRFFGLQPAATWRDELVLVTPWFVVLTLVSSQTGINEHFRYVLPVFPFAIIWISQAARGWSGHITSPALVVAVFLIWSVSSSLWVYPHSLSYFNELVGGPRGGAGHMIISSIDWGQDLLYLKRWLDRHPERRPLHLIYYGECDPQVAGINFTASFENDNTSGSIEPRWYVVSVNFLQGYPWRAYDGSGSQRSIPKGAYTFLQHVEPIATAGYSIYIYQLTPQDVDEAKRGEPQ